MDALPFKLLFLAIGLAFVLAAAGPADAKGRKHRRHLLTHKLTTIVDRLRDRENASPRGPIYNGPDYLGDDPDPNIRFQIMRDLGAHYGGEN